jgi:hypothetical protein
MNSEVQSIKRSLRQRQAELTELINQMKQDQLNRGAVFKTLESELTTVVEQLREDLEQEKR